MRRFPASATGCAAALLLSFAVCAQNPAPKPSAAAAAQANAQGDRVRQAENLLEHGDFKGAEVVLAELAKATPDDPRVLFDLGFTEEHNGEDAAASKAYTAAIAADGSLPEPRVALGLLEARQGHAEAARTQLDAVAQTGNAAPALRGRALRALARLNDADHPERANDELLQAVQLSGKQPGDADLSAELAARLGDAGAAETAYRQALARSPGDLEATLGLASLLQKQGKLPEADALLTPALAAHPDAPQLAAEAAALYAAEGKTAEAITLLTRLRTDDARAASDPALTELLAHLDLVSGDATAAEPLYRSLGAAAPNDPRLLDELGSTLVREQKFAEAEAVLARAVAMRAAFHDDGAWGEAAGHLAFAASRNHQPEVALQALAGRATVLPNSAASLFLEATSYDTLHQVRKAAERYRAFLAIAGGKLPDEEFEARHRLVALEHEH